MTHAEIKEGRDVEIREGDEGITIQGKKGGLIHKNASETDPALKIDRNGSDVVKRAREIEVVDNNSDEEEVVDEAKEEEVEEPAKAVEDGTEDGPIEIVDDEKEEAAEDASIEKQVDTALEDVDLDVEMESPKKNGVEKSAGEKRDRDDLDDLEEASSGGERESEEDASSTGDGGVKKQKKNHLDDNQVVTAILAAEEVVQDALPLKKIDENIQKAEAEESVVGAHEEDVAVPV